MKKQILSTLKRFCRKTLFQTTYLSLSGDAGRSQVESVLFVVNSHSGHITGLGGYNRMTS